MMPRSHKFCRRTLLALVAGMAVMVGFQPWAFAGEIERTTIHIIVTDLESGKPINQASLTLLFQEPTRKLGVKATKQVSFSAKTNPQGKYRFTDIPKGTIRLLVTAERHKSFGKDIEVTQDNQEIEVKLKKPQPQL